MRPGGEWAAMAGGGGSHTGRRNHAREAQGLGRQEATNDPSRVQEERVAWEEDGSQAGPSLM